MAMPLGSFNDHFLNCIIYGCITDTQFLKKIRQSFPLDAYKDPIRTRVAEIIYRYIDQYDEAPDEHFYDLFDEFLETVPKPKQRLYLSYIRVLRDIENYNPEYILDKVFEAVRHIRIEEAVVEAARLVTSKKYDEAKRAILDAFKDPVTRKFQYLDYFSSKDDLISRVSQKPYLMQTMIPSLDRIIGGIRRQEVVIWLGTPKAGKTYGLISMAHAALLQGLVVVFISLELHRERISGRMDQTAGFLGGTKAPRQEVLEWRRNRWVKRTKEIDNIYDLRTVLETRGKLAKYGGKLIIASAPGGTRSYQDIELFLDELETHDRIMPQIVIVDYLRNMKGMVPAQKTKERISWNCQGLVKIASERDCIVFSAQQGNRQAMRSNILYPHMIADDIDPIGYVDMVIPICQTEEEQARNQARLYLAIVREGAAGAVIRVTRDLSRGQFWLDDELVQREESGWND